jgi:hypothetical protein
MRKLIRSVVLPMACLLASETMAHPFITDSVKVNHSTDGNIDEWKPEKFETDKGTLTAYSIDHDATNLYLVLKVTDQAMQMKMMMQGMSLYLDKNGKKKERTGIQFPVKRESGGGGQRGGGMPSGAGNGSAPDQKEMMERIASTMIILKTFGFENQDEEKTQLLAEADGINVAFEWDNANNLCIEYQVPLSLLGKPADLKDKTLGLGWKIHGMEAGAPTMVSTSTQIVGVPAGRGGGGAPGGNAGRGARPSNASFGSSSDPRFKEQTVWTKYILTF